MSQINVGLDVNCPQAVDRSYGKLQAGTNIPYASVAEANATIIPSFRYQGKTVILAIGGASPVEYWWRVDTQDGSLVPKVLGEQNIDFIIGDGGAFTPAPGSSVYTNAAIKNCVVLGFQVEGADIFLGTRANVACAQYDINAGTITLGNTVFSADAWYRIKIRQL